MASSSKSSNFSDLPVAADMPPSAVDAKVSVEPEVKADPKATIPDNVSGGSKKSPITQLKETIASALAAASSYATKMLGSKNEMMDSTDYSETKPDLKEKAARIKGHAMEGAEGASNAIKGAAIKIKDEVKS